MERSIDLIRVQRAAVPRHGPRVAVRALLGLVLLLFTLAPAAAQRADAAALEADFQRWLAEQIWPEASARGISRATFELAFAGVHLDLDLPELVLPGAGPAPAIDQPEFRSPAPYFREDNLAAAARAGQARLAEWRDTLAAIERRFGVPGPIILAVWGRETNFGREVLPHDAIEAIATEAFLGRRAADSRVELFAALLMLERGDVARSALRSSWAGALGQPQLLPTGYLEYAVDFDGDGRRDIWNSVPDSLASIANLLARSGWDSREPWGVEVPLPAASLCALEGPTQGRSILAWRDLGFAISAPLGARRATRFLLAPAGALGPTFLVSQNFYVVKEYNFSDVYALYVVHLADRIAGNDRSFSLPWQAIDRIDHGQIQAAQRSLEALGYDVGGADGLVGFRTRVAIGGYQSRAGLPVTCFPNAAVLQSLR